MDVLSMNAANNGYWASLLCSLTQYKQHIYIEGKLGVA